MGILHPPQVDDDIIGGIDDATGKPEGLEFVNSVFPMFGLVPGQLEAPGWSHDPGLVGNLSSHLENRPHKMLTSDSYPTRWFISNKFGF
jgi:hypothetical protein